MMGESIRQIWVKIRNVPASHKYIGEDKVSNVFYLEENILKSLLFFSSDGTRSLLLVPWNYFSLSMTTKTVLLKN